MYMQDCGECAPERGAAEPVMVDCLIDRQKLCWRARIRKPRIQLRNRALIEFSAIDPIGISPSFYDAAQLLHPPK